MTTKPAQPVTQLDLDQCKPDDSIQSRAELDSETVELYAEDIRNGAEFPAVVVFRDGKRYWLASGFHRWHAHQRAGHKKIRAHVMEGDRRAAILFSVGANEKQGLRRTNADKRRAVRLLLSDEEWWLKSDHWIAEKCHVSHTFVGDVREEMQDEMDEAAAAAAEEDTDTEGDEGAVLLESASSENKPKPPAGQTSQPRQSRHKSGQTVTMNTGNISKSNRQRPAVILIEKDPKKRELIAKQEIRSLPKWIKQCKRLGLTLQRAKERLEEEWLKIVAEAG